MCILPLDMSLSVIASPQYKLALRPSGFSGVTLKIYKRHQASPFQLGVTFLFVVIRDASTVFLSLIVRAEIRLPHPPDGWTATPTCRDRTINFVIEV